MIALRLRSNGHSREAVEETIRACAPTTRDLQTGRNWQRYAERTADYAFGPAGDRDMERNERYRDLWRRLKGGRKGADLGEDAVTLAAKIQAGRVAFVAISLCFQQCSH